MWSSQAQYKSIQWLIACSCSDHLIIQRLSLVFNLSLCNMRLNSVGCILVLFLYKSKVAVLKLNHRPVSTTSNINGGTCLYLVYLERNRFAIPSDLSQWVDILLHRLNWRHQLMSDHRPGPRLWSNTFKDNTATSVEMVAVIFVLLWSPSTVA